MYCVKCQQQYEIHVKYCSFCGGPTQRETGDYQNPASSTEVLEYAGFGNRLGGYVFDIVGVGLAGLLLLYLIDLLAKYYSWIHSGVPEIKTFADILKWSFIIGFPLVFFSWCECSSYQATPGKKAMGIKVVDLRGNRLTFGRALVRNLGQIVSGVFGIGYLIALFTPRRQALHDYMASCVVVIDKERKTLRKPSKKTTYKNQGNNIKP